MVRCLKRKVLIVFDDIMADMISNPKRSQIVTELFIRERKLKISIVFITQSYFAVPKDVKLYQKMLDYTVHLFCDENSR